MHQKLQIWQDSQNGARQPFAIINFHKIVTVHAIKMKFGNYLPVWFLKGERVHVYLSESAALEGNTIFEMAPGSHYLMVFFLKLSWQFMLYTKMTFGTGIQINVIKKCVLGRICNCCKNLYIIWHLVIIMNFFIPLIRNIHIIVESGWYKGITNTG